MRSCFFTGHRSFMFSRDPAAVENLRELLSDLAKNGITDFYAGGSYGWDMICEYSVFLLKKDYPKAIIAGHNVFSNKACPCFDAVKEYADLQP